MATAVQGGVPVTPPEPRSWRAFTIAAWAVVAALPLIGFLSLLMRDQLDPNLSNPQLHFGLFLAVGAGLLIIAYDAGESAERRGDARVLLISLAFLATGAFLMLHAFGTAGVLFEDERAGFKIAIPVGLLISAAFALSSAFVDARPHFAPAVVRHRVLLWRVVLGAAAVWLAWTIAELPPLDRPSNEGGTRDGLAVLAAVATLAYGISAVRYLVVYRDRPGLLPASIVACFALLSEAMIGVAITGERAWHASWWEWHGLIVLAYVVVAFAARREWRDERFRNLYLETTRERGQEVSVLFSDLAGFTSFAERSTPAEVATVLNTYYAMAAPLISRRFGGELEKFMGDGMMATFNSRGDQPDHAVRAAGAALALQEELGRLAEANPGWPRLRVGINSGEAMVREMGGHGFVAYAVIGDTVNTASRLEGQAPVGGVLIGERTRALLPEGASAEAVTGVLVKGKEAPLDAFLLHALP
jgi:adenylate cyclase